MAPAGEVMKVGDDAEDFDGFAELFACNPTDPPEDVSSSLSSSSQVVSDVTRHEGKSFVFGSFHSLLERGGGGGGGRSNKQNPGHCSKIDSRNLQA